MSVCLYSCMFVCSVCHEVKHRLLSHVAQAIVTPFGPWPKSQWHQTFTPLGHFLFLLEGGVIKNDTQVLPESHHHPFYGLSPCPGLLHTGHQFRNSICPINQCLSTSSLLGTLGLTIFLTHLSSPGKTCGPSPSSPSSSPSSSTKNPQTHLCFWWPTSISCDQFQDFCVFADYLVTLCPSQTYFTTLILYCCEIPFSYRTYFILYFFLETWMNAGQPDGAPICL